MSGRASEMLRAVEAAGGQVLRRAHHGHLYRPPNGATLLVAGSPGDARSAANNRAALRRALRGGR